MNSEAPLPMITKERDIWTAWTNTDCTEGRGFQIPIAHCERESTALRHGDKQSVQGTTDVQRGKAYYINGRWYAEACLLPMTNDDIAKQKAMDARAAALAKAKEAGLTDEDIRALWKP